MAQSLQIMVIMCQLLTYRHLLPATLSISFALIACGGSETAQPQSDNTQGGSTGTTRAQGGGTATTAPAGGTTKVGGDQPVGTGGAYSTASAGTATAGGSSAGGAMPATGASSAGGATSVNTGGTTGTTAPPQCDSTQTRRDITVRLVFPAGLTAPTTATISYGDAVTRQVDGTLQPLTEVTESCSSCANGTRQALSIPLTDDTGKSWALIAYPVELVAGWAAAVTPLVGQRLSLMFRYTRGFQSVLSTGFVLSDTAGPVVAAEQAQFVTALKPADLPGFTVALGEPICTASGGCAQNVFTTLNFSGDSKVTVGLTADDEFTIGSQRYMATNLGAGYLIVATCKDLERASPWSIWRKVGP